jgi:hypothetical protein
MLRKSLIPPKIRSLMRLAAGAALFAVATAGFARADSDGIYKINQVNVAANPITCNFSTPNSSFFSFDISWIDANDRIYLLADRSHGDPSSNTQGGLLSGGTTGDILMIDINTHKVSALKPPASDPFAGVRCDANAAFGGSTAAGRNELTGPNGVFTVNGVEAWAGDGPSYFNPGQTNSASDYASDPCNSSVRVFSLITHQQTDHINIHGCFRTDEGAFDAKDQIALFANPSELPITSPHFDASLNSSPFISLISTKPVAPGNSHPILAQINFDGTNGTVNADGGIEQAVWSRKTGMFYIAVPGNSANPTAGWITVVDPAQMKVIANYGTPNCSPHGLAVGLAGNLYLGCNAGPQEVMDPNTGSILAVLTGTTGGCDEVAYNAGDKHYVGACTDTHAPIDNVDISDAKGMVFDTAINTGAAGAHSIAADPVTATDWDPMYQGACGTGKACVAIYGSTNGDDRNGKE